MKRMAARIFVMAFALATSARAQPVDIDMVVGSTALGRGALALEYDFTRPVRVTPSVSDGGLTRHSSTQPGFETLERAASGFFPLADGTPVGVEITAIDPTVSFKIGATTLDAAGASVDLGVVPNLHVHGEWRLTIPDESLATASLALRLVTTARSYSASPSYGFTITNDPSVTTATTTTTLPGSNAVDRPVGGATMLLRNGRMAITVRDAGVDRGRGPRTPDDPTVLGGNLRLLGDQAAPFDARVALTADNWRVTRKGYRYRDGTGFARQVALTAGRGLRVSARGDDLAFMLGSQPAGLTVVVTVGERRYCIDFDTITQFKPGKRLRLEATSPPIGCPPA
jgi:hypothetical protein